MGESMWKIYKACPIFLKVFLFSLKDLKLEVQGIFK
jgi:hypothetical protein